MALIATAMLGIIFGHRAFPRSAGIRVSIPCAISGVDVSYRANTSYPFIGRWPRYSGRCHSVVGLTLLIAVVTIGITELQSQTDAPANSPSSADAYLMRGEILSGNQQYDRAIADYTAAIELKPDYAEAYNNRGFAYYLKGEFERAISDYTRAIQLRPNYPKAYNSRGVVYMQGGYGAAKSVPDFDRAIELKPDFRYAYINRANARLRAHPLLALQDFHRAGMHPERALAVVACVFLLFALAVTLLILRRRRSRGLETSGPA